MTQVLPPAARDVERRKKVRLRIRHDLNITPQRYEGVTYYVVKDPVSLRYWRFKEKEHFLLKLMNGQIAMEDAQKAYEERFRPERLTLEDLEAFGQQLLTAGLAYNESAQVGKQLFEQRTKRRRSEWMQMVTNILYIKIPVFDPDKILTKMMPYTRFIFTAWFGLVSVGFMLAAIMLVATHFTTFRDKLPAYHEFFSMRNLVYMWLCLGVVKVIHEFGHGLSCKRFGGEVHEMGFLFLCLSPCLYCNVSDSWTPPNKRHRIIISAAGIYVELIIAALATFVWWNSTAHPLVNQVSLSLMVVCSVSTVIFNANPLMRFDGYYVLADWLEIPNLRDRANKFLTRLATDLCLGIEQQPEAYMALDRKILFVTYAIVSYIYRWVITFSILWFLYMFLKPYKLGAISALLAYAAALSMVGWPVYRLMKNIYRRGRLPDMKRWRVNVTLGVLGALVLAFFFLPLPLARIRERALVQIQPEALERVYVSEPAILEKQYVRDGETITKNAELAKFRSIELENQLRSAKSDYALRANQYDAAVQMKYPTMTREEEDRLGSEIKRLKGERDIYRTKVDGLTEKFQNLTLLAPRDGVVINPPAVDEVGKLWEKERTSPFCTIGDPTRLRVLMPITTSQFKLLETDFKALKAKGKDLDIVLRVQGLGGKTWKGRVTHLPESEAKEIPVSLSDRAGGPVAVKPAQKQQEGLAPVKQQYLVPIEIVEPDSSICPGAMAQVKVHLQWHTAWWWLKHTISEVFELGLM